MKEYYPQEDEMPKHVDERDGEIKEMFTATSMLLTINEHTTRTLNQSTTFYQQRGRLDTMVATIEHPGGNWVAGKLRVC
jgi:hypothetical protein